jgi:rubrerythrin
LLFHEGIPKDLPGIPAANGLGRRVPPNLTIRRRIMKLPRIVTGALILVPGFVLAAGLVAREARSVETQPAGSKVIQNLQTAYEGESNARARYLAFAKKADAEGFASVASLFRAAARAEEIHAANHAAVLKKLNVPAKADIAQPDVKSTKENLEAAIKGETYERDVMYPEFLREAKSQKNTDAVQTFNYAKSAEAEHAKLYTEALGTLSTAKGEARSFYVCTVCGFTTTSLDFAKCVVCFSPKDKYIKVS